MEFKGDKGKWIIDDVETHINKHNVKTFVISTENRDVVYIADVYRDEYNALLISKAPEMLEMLQQIYQKIDFSFDAFGSDDGLKMQSEIKQLIEEATEL